MFSKYMPLSRIVMIMAVAALVLGIVFVVQGVTKANMIKEQMREEAVPASMFIGNATAGDVIDSAGEAQKAADTIKEHRQKIAPNYEALLAGGRYDPTNPKHLSYTQALNMENYLYMGVFALGFTQAVTVIGVFMIVVGIALMAVWAAIRKKKAAEVKAKST
jgi:uncharacterized membrane protein